jgi:hypothetical protein
MYGRGRRGDEGRERKRGSGQDESEKGKTVVEYKTVWQRC